MNGERHESFVGRPVSFHAMRGISAHSNGFQTARALHLLQVLIGAIDCPGGFRYEPPYPKPVEAHPTPHGRAEHFGSNKPLSGPHLGFPRGPEDMLIDADGKPNRIDKAFSWDAPFSVHGLMHMVISNAHAGDPYPVDVLFLYMANMAWNSSMNTAGVIKMLEDKDPATGEYRIPKIIYSDAYASEMVAYADLVLPDTTYLERHDCISLLDRPISEPDAVQDAIRWPVVEPDRDVRGFQSVLIDLAGRLKLNGFVDHRGTPLYKDYADYIVRHERRPGIGPLAGFRGPAGDRTGRGAVNPDQLKRYIENGSFFSAHIPLEAQFFKHANKAYQDFAVRMGFFDQPQPVTFQLYQESLQKFRLSAEGKREPMPPATHRQRILDAFDPLPHWYQPFEEALVDRAGISAARDHPAAGGDVPFLGLDECLAQADPHQERAVRAGPGLRRARPRRRRLGAGDLASRRASRWRSPAPRRPMPARIWTWNGIGKREGSWGLDRDAPEAQKGFLMNHLIHELLPPKGDGMRWSNSDPITGQAAWYDLRVRIEKIERAAVSEPHFAAGRRARQAARAARRAALRAGVGEMTLLPSQRSPKKLGLVIDLDVCVGCHACVVSCKEWNTGGYGAALVRPASLRRRRFRRLAEPRPHIRGGARGRRDRRRGGRGAHRAFPEILPALRRRALRHRLPDRRVLQALGRRHRAGRRGQMHRLRPVRLGLPLWRARDGPCRRRHEEMHAVHRPHLQRDVRKRSTACRPACAPARPMPAISAISAIRRRPFR